MIIRKALSQDNISIATVLGELITSYYDDVEIKKSIIKDLETHSLSPQSILFYENCNVCVIEGKIAGVVSFYSGDMDKEFTKNLTEVTSKYDTENASGKPQLTSEKTNKNIIPQGLYLSMVSVLPEFQGKKIGHKLIASVEEAASLRGYDRVSIKVDMYNPRAEELYRKLGYEYVDEYIADGVTLKYLEKRVDL